MITRISAYIMPLVILIIVGYGLYKKSDNYDNFIKGAADGMKTVVDIGHAIGSVTEKAGIPADIIPLVIVRLFSSSAATGLSLDIFRQFGTDSYAGLVTSILMGCTETVFYTMSVYFMAAKIKKTRWTLAGALAATAAGVLASIVLSAVFN